MDSTFNSPQLSKSTPIGPKDCIGGLRRNPPFSAFKTGLRLENANGSAYKSPGFASGPASRWAPIHHPSSFCQN
jgi:hypothetical protein